MANIDDARSHWAKVSGGFKKNRDIRYAWTGDGRGTAASNYYYGDRKQYIWVREDDNRPFPVLNRGNVSPTINLPVVLGYDDIDPHLEQVLDINWSALPANSTGSTIYNIGAHHTQHEWRGGDEVFIDSRQFTTGAVAPTNPTSMQVKVFPFTYYSDGWKRFAGETSSDFTAHIPSSASYSRAILVAFDMENEEVTYTVGEQFPTPETWDKLLVSVDPFATLPNVPTGHKPLGALLLSKNTTNFNWNAATDNIIDMRHHFDNAEYATSIGQINISLDGKGFKPKTPVTEKQVGLLFDSVTGHIIVA